MRRARQQMNRAMRSTRRLSTPCRRPKFGHEQQVGDNEKSQKRISGEPSQANDCVKLSMARRTAALEAFENALEILREERRVLTRMAAEKAKADGKAATAKMEATEKEAHGAMERGSGSQGRSRCHPVKPLWPVRLPYLQFHFVSPLCRTSGNSPSMMLRQTPATA